MPDGVLGGDDLLFILCGGSALMVQHVYFVIPLARRIEPSWDYMSFKFYVPMIIYVMLHLGWYLYSPAVRLLPFTVIVPACLWFPFVHVSAFFLPKATREQPFFRLRIRKMLLFHFLFLVLVFYAYSYAVAISLSRGLQYAQIIVNICFGLGTYFIKRWMCRLSLEMTNRWTFNAVVLFMCDSMQIAFQNLMFMSSITPATVAVSVSVHLLLQARLFTACSEVYQTKKTALVRNLGIAPLEFILDDTVYASKFLSMKELRRLRCNSLLFGSCMAHSFGLVSFMLLSTLMRNSANARFYPFSDASLLLAGGAPNQYNLAMVFVTVSSVVEFAIAAVFVGVARWRWGVDDNLGFVVHTFRRESSYIVGVCAAVFGFLWVGFSWQFQIYAFVFPQHYFLFS
eukprot:TRINITY_DN8950_c0_g2_i1.p1 TRINITY_DN8950_c0_g2~~TRINITY_DN8950_c0_g2_i1.p1  ORF type:complete len:398 (-),score=145.66 TRINITY_DN8950_c0_g2_i1:898-2091(-)